MKSELPTGHFSNLLGTRVWINRDIVSQDFATGIDYIEGEIIGAHPHKKGFDYLIRWQGHEIVCDPKEISFDRPLPKIYKTHNKLNRKVLSK